MEQLRRLCKYHFATGLYQVHAGTEVVVYRRPFEETLFNSFSFTGFIIYPLQYHRQVLYEEYPAENRYQQFFVDDDGFFGNDTADGQAARITHEYLCRISVVPKEADHRTDEGANEDYQFFRSWDIHDIQIAGIFDVAGYVCQYTQRQTDNGGVACCHAVHAVVQVGAVGDGGYHENRNEHEQYPAGCLCVFSHEGDKVCIVQVIAFEKRNGGLCSLDFFGSMYYFNALPRIFHFNILTNDNLRAEV